MIIVNIIGGLGNQMFQYAMARSVSKKLKNDFKLDISSFENYKLHHGYRLNNFNIIENIAKKEEINKLRGYEGIFRKILNKLNLDIIRPNSYFKERFFTKYNEEVFNNSLYFNGYWQNCKYFENIRDILLKEFTPKDISSQAEFYLDKINNRSVSIHVRRGDYLKLHHIYNILDITYFKKAIDFLLTQEQNLNFFIFSDDINWCKKNLHIDGIYIDNTTEIDDMFLMSKMKYNIISNSTFSWWGAWLNKNEDKIIIAPKQWFTKEEWKNLNINCGGWIEI